jgi:hypothetical protein
MSENLFNYNPIQEWNGQVINFGTGSSQRNYELTEIVSYAEGAQEAFSLVDYTIYDSDTYKEINRIIRLFFSGDEFDVEVSDWIDDPTEIYEIYTELPEFSLTIVSEYEIFLDKESSFKTSSSYPLYTPTGCYTDDFNKPRLSENSNNSCMAAGGTWLDGTYDTPFYSRKHIEGPRNLTTSSGNLGGTASTLGMPYIRLQWYGGALDNRCSNSSYSTQTICEQMRYVHCTDDSTGSPVTIHKMNNPTLWTTPNLSEYTCGQLSLYPNYCYYSSNGTSWNRWTTNTSSCTATANGTLYSNLYWLPIGTSTTQYNESGDWWPTSHTQSIVQSQVVYEGNSIYTYPSEWTTSQSATLNDITINYDELPNSGQKTPGRQTRIFWIGYAILDNLELQKTVINPALDYVYADMPPHVSVSSSAGIPLSVYGFLNNSNGTKIRWKSPQSTTSINSRLYPPPSFYRIYRSNYYFYGSTSPTDYTRGIKHLISEQPHTEDVNYMYFEEDETILRSEGMLPQQRTYYFVTAVWNDFLLSNTGLFATYYNGYFGSTILPYLGDDHVVEWFDTAIAGSTVTWPSIDMSTTGTTFSYKVTGYFRASVTGTYNFRLNTDDASYLWIGSSGTTYGNLQTIATGATSLINNGGLHPVASVSADISLTAGEYYPILMYYGEYNGYETFELYFTPPGETETQNGWSYYFTDDDDGTNGIGTDVQEREGNFSTNSAYSSFS